MANGVITRKDIIEDQAMTIGPDYAKGMQQAIAANKELVSSLKEMAPLVNAFRKTDNQQAYVTLKQQENLITLQAINANKLLEASEISLERIKQAKLKTEKEALAVQSKVESGKRTTTKLTAEERVQNEINNRILKQTARENLGLVGAYEKLNKARTDAKNKLRDLISSEQASTSEIKKAQKEYDILNRKVIAADHAVDDFTKSVGNYPLANVTSGIKNLIAAFGVTTGIALFVGIMKGAYDTIKKFEQSVADLSAITGAAGKDLDYLRNQAILLGRDTKGGATAVVEAYKLIASAKPELLENVQALNQVTEAVLLLSKAAGMEMPEAATALTDAMNQFGADASRAGVFVDTLANGAKYGAAEIPQITEALLKFGAVARNTNVSIGESTALIELLAENGLKGADAGTALRNVLLKLSAPDALPRKAQEAIRDLGISFDYLKDKSVPIQAKLEALKPILKDNANIVKIFGLENAVAATNIIEHTDRLKELTSKMNESGTATEQANTRMDTLEGSMIKLSSAYDSFILSLNDRNKLGSALKWVTDELTSTVEGWRKIFTSNEKLKEEEMAKIRKEGFDSIAKSYSDKNKLDENQLNIVKKLNSQEILENTNKVNALISENKRLSKNTVPLTGAIKMDSFDKIMKNRREIDELNKSTNSLVGKNDGINSLIKSRQPSKVRPTNTASGGTDEEDEKATRDKLSAEKKLNDDLYALQKQRLERTINLSDEIVKDDKENDEIRIAAALNSQQKQIELAELTKQHALDADKFVLEKDKLSANEKTRIKEEAAYKIVDIEKKTSEEIDKINQFDAKAYEDNLKEGVTKIETAMNEELAAENERFAALGDLEAMSQKDREKAVEDHERRIFEIKKEFAIATANLQVSNLQAELDAFKAQSDGSKESAAIILDIEKRLSEARLRLTELGVDNFKEGEEKKTKSTKEQAIEILEISSDLTNALDDLANAFTERKIQKIDIEIEKNNEYYDKQIELAKNDERQKSFYEEQRAKKNEQLEKKKRKEQEKQAIFNKAATAVEVAIQTSLAVISALAQVPKFDFGISASAIAGIYAGIGAIQLAAVLAAPIPKYKMGRKGGPAEIAEVGDGYVNEVISRPDGTGARLTPNKPTLTYLQKDDVVHKSMADYNEYMRRAMLKGFHKERERANSYQFIHNNTQDNTELLRELKRNTEAIQKQKTHISVNNNVDLGHEYWRTGNIKWRG